MNIISKEIKQIESQTPLDENLELINEIEKKANKKKKKKKAKKEKTLDNSVLNIIRTTLRNNIELTGIADNKANVLLSLNALMLTFLIPFTLPHLDTVREYHLVYPIVILVITSLTTIYMSALVLMPSKFYEGLSSLQKGRYVSPFFFGNFYKLDKSEFTEYIKDAVADGNMVKRHVTEDLHYIGSRLGTKMALIRTAFKVFIFGFSVAIGLTLILLVVFH